MSNLPMSGGSMRILPAGELLGSCTVLDLVGRGSMGAVYRAWQKSLSRQVAAKVLMKERFDKLITPERFMQEAETAANINHPGIVSIYELGERDDCLFFVMQFIEGPSLGDWMRRRLKHPLPSRRHPNLAELVDVGRQVLEALQHAHDVGIVHRDVKPENILWLGQTGRLLITDFGLASVNYFHHEAEKAYVIGSPLYVSPEQARGDEVDGRADLFSLGCVLLELTLGFLPVRVERPERIFRIRAQEDPSMFTGTAREHRPEIPEKWDAFLQKSLAPRRDDRFPDARAMLKALLATAS